MKNPWFCVGTSIFATALALLTLVPALSYSQQDQKNDQKNKDQASPQPAIQAATVISYEGQKVSSVQLGGQPEANRRTLQDLIAQPVNAPYSQAKVDATVEALKKAGNFQAVEVQVTPAPEGLRVLFVLQPAYYFGVFTFSKAEKVYSYTRLLQAANYSKQEPYSQESLEEAESNLLDLFHRSGYFQATVEPKLQTDKEHGVVNVVFDINLKRHAKFGDLTLTGIPGDESTRLAKSLHSIRARIKGAYIKQGKTYSAKKVQSAQTYLQQQLGKQHFLAAQVKLTSTRYNPETNRADLAFQITEGPQIAIKIEGAHVWGRTQKKLIPMYQENSVDPDLVAEGTQNLTSYFQSKGYFDVKVTSQFQKQANG